MKTVRKGKSYAVHFSGCAEKRINEAEWLENLLNETAKQTGATLCGSLRKRFEPQGASAVSLLAESHYSAHSWPESGELVGEFYTCGQIDSAAAVIAVAGALQADAGWGCMVDFDRRSITRFKLKKTRGRKIKMEYYRGSARSL